MQQDLLWSKWAINVLSYHFHQWQPCKPVFRQPRFHTSHTWGAKFTGWSYTETSGIREKARCGLLLVFCKPSFTIYKTKVDSCFDFSFRGRNSEPELVSKDLNMRDSNCSLQKPFFRALSCYKKLEVVSFHLSCKQNKHDPACWSAGKFVFPVFYALTWSHSELSESWPAKLYDDSL